MSRSVVLVAIYLDEDSQKEHMATYLIIKKEYPLQENCCFAAVFTRRYFI
jgi:hypothetical protein